MKKLILMLMLCAPMTMFAQKFGHLDSQALLQSLPEATSVQQNLRQKARNMRNNSPTCRQNSSARLRNTTRPRAR